MRDLRGFWKNEKSRNKKSKKNTNYVLTQQKFDDRILLVSERDRSDRPQERYGEVSKWS